MIITLPLYLLGWLAIPRRGNGAAILLALLPIVATGFVTAWTISLASGASACELITGLPFEKDGREQMFAALWGLACLVFWLGLAISMKLADWRGANSVETE